MSEKRFELTEINPSVNPLDTVYFIIDYENPSKNIRNLKDCVDLLNYQDRLIEEQHDEIINWTKKYVGIKKENEQLQNELASVCVQKSLICDELEILKKVIDDE